MIPEDLKNAEENILRYKDRISNLSKDFEIGLFIFLLAKVCIFQGFKCILRYVNNNLYFIFL